MGDEYEALLKITGDASGAVAAAQQGSTAMQGLGDAAKQVGAAQLEAAQAPTAAMEEQTAATKDMGDAEARRGRGGRRAGDESPQVRDDPQPNFAGTRASVHTAFAAKEGLGLLFSPMGAGIAATAAALVGLKAYLDDVIDTADRLRQTNDALAESTRKAVTELQKLLATKGVPSEEAANRGTAEVRKLKEQGLTEEAARDVMGQAFDQTGKLALTPEQLTQATALREAKPEAFPKEGGPEMLKAAVAGNQKVIQDYLKAVGDVQARDAEDAMQLRTAAMRRVLERHGLSFGGNEQEQTAAWDEALQDIKAVGEHGEVEANPLTYSSRQATAVDRARQLNIISQSQANAVRDRGFWGHVGRGFMADMDTTFRSAEDALGIKMGPAARTDLPSPAAPTAASGQQIVITGGVVNIGGGAGEPQIRMAGA